MSKKKQDADALKAAILATNLAKVSSILKKRPALANASVAVTPNLAKLLACDASAAVPVLFYACWSGDSQICKTLLAAGAQASVVAHDWTAPLLACVTPDARQALQSLQLLVAAKADASLCAPTGVSTLGLAAQKLDSEDSAKLLDFLLENGAFTPQMSMKAACIVGQHLLRHGAYTSTVSRLKDKLAFPSPACAGLFRALQWQGHSNADDARKGLDLLLAAGLSDAKHIDAPLAADDLPPLFHSLTAPAHLRALLSAKASANVRAEQQGGLTPLFVATQTKNTDAARLLLEFRADASLAEVPSGETKSAWTALQQLSSAVGESDSGSAVLSAPAAADAKLAASDLADEKRGVDDAASGRAKVEAADAEDAERVAEMRALGKAALEKKVAAALAAHASGASGALDEPALRHALVALAQTAPTLQTLFSQLLPIACAARGDSVRSALVQCVVYICQQALRAQTKPAAGAMGLSVSPKQAQQFLEAFLAAPGNPMLCFLVSALPSLLSTVCDHAEGRKLLCRALKASNAVAFAAAGSKSASDEKSAAAAGASSGSPMLRAMIAGWCASLATAAATVAAQESRFRLLRCLAAQGYHVALAEALLSGYIELQAELKQAAALSDAKAAANAQSLARVNAAQRQTRVLESLVHLCNMPDAMLQTFLYFESTSEGKSFDMLAEMITQSVDAVTSRSSDAVLASLGPLALRLLHTFVFPVAHGFSQFTRQVLYAPPPFTLEEPFDLYAFSGAAADDPRRLATREAKQAHAARWRDRPAPSGAKDPSDKDPRDTLNREMLSMELMVEPQTLEHTRAHLMNTLPLWRALVRLATRTPPDVRHLPKPMQHQWQSCVGMAQQVVLKCQPESEDPPLPDEPAAAVSSSPAPVATTAAAHSPVTSASLTIDKCAKCAAAATTGEQLKLCARCRGVAYCSVACQKAHWPVHKRSCKTASR